MSKLHSIEIGKLRWNLIVWIPIILGGIIFSIFTSGYFMKPECVRASWFAAIGLLLVGCGFGLAYARAFNIEGIDTIKLREVK